MFESPLCQINTIQCRFFSRDAIHANHQLPICAHGHLRCQLSWKCACVFDSCADHWLNVFHSSGWPSCLSDRDAAKWKYCVMLVVLSRYISIINICWSANVWNIVRMFNMVFEVNFMFATSNTPCLEGLGSLGARSLIDQHKSFCVKCWSDEIPRNISRMHLLQCFDNSSQNAATCLFYFINCASQGTPSDTVPLCVTPGTWKQVFGMPAGPFERVVTKEPFHSLLLKILYVNLFKCCRTYNNQSSRLWMALIIHSK